MPTEFNIKLEVNQKLKFREAVIMTWNKGLALTTANKLFGKYGVLITQDPNTKIYAATKGGQSIQHTSVTAIAEAVLENWFEVKE